MFDRQAPLPSYKELAGLLLGSHAHDALQLLHSSLRKPNEPPVQSMSARSLARCLRCCYLREWRVKRALEWIGMPVKA